MTDLSQQRIGFPRIALLLFCAVLPTIRPTLTQSLTREPMPTLAVQATSQLFSCDSLGEMQLGSFLSEIVCANVDWQEPLMGSYRGKSPG